MKLRIVFSLSACLFAAAYGQTRKESPASPSVAAPAPNLQIPARAVKGDDGSYRYTDPQGKKWIYRKTPFGIARFEDKPAPVDDATATRRFEAVKATEDGDSIRFERPGPFGVYKWQRKKTELDEMEQTVWDRERVRIASRQD